MKTLLKLLTGILLVALTAFGLTALTSSSTNSSYDTRVMAFLNETCNSLELMLFQNATDMLDFYGTEMDGVIWNFESYINVSDYEFTENPECNLVSEIRNLPEVRVVKPKPKIIPVDPPPGGGGGGGGGDKKPPAKKKTEVEFDSQDARELKNCLQNKLTTLGTKLKDVTDMLDDVELENLGCFVKMGLNNLKFKKTDYRWRTSLREDGIMGLTIHKPGTKTLDKTVTLYPKAIQRRVKDLSNWGVSFENLSSNVGLDEMVHTIQGHNSLLADDTWKNPKPYEKYNLQLQSNVYAYIWYKQLHNDGDPPIDLYDKDTFNEWRDDECNLKENSAFVKKKKEYLKFEKQLEDKTLKDMCARLGVR